MADTARIREICERNEKILMLKPGRGHLTGVTRARIDDGLRCVVEEGPWRMVTDMPARAGGEDSGPPPGTFGRGALASCIATGITMWAARLGIGIDAVEVEVQADFDARGEMGIGESPPGYTSVRHIVSIESPAPRAALIELTEIAWRCSPYIDVFARSQDITGVLRVNGKEI